MPRDEALPLAQILVGLLLFTMGVPAVIVETRVDESLRRILHKRIRPVPMLVLGIFTMALIVILIALSGENVEPTTESLIRSLSAADITLFAGVWFYIYMNVRISLVIGNVVRDMKKKLKREGVISNPDLADLLTLGENLRGSEKNEVIRAVGQLIHAVQNRKEYNGSRLKALVRGLPRIVEMNGTIEHHNSARRVIEGSWQTILKLDLFKDNDADFIKNAACELGSLAVTRQLESVALRWISTFPWDLDVPLVIEVPYRIGAAAIGQGQGSVAVAALSRMKLIAGVREQLPKELIALVAHFHAAGPAAAQTARHFIDKLKRSPEEVRMAAGKAAHDFREDGDYATADAIESFRQSVIV